MIKGEKITKKNFSEQMVNTGTVESSSFVNIKFNQVLFGKGLSIKIRSNFSKVIFENCNFVGGSFNSCFLKDVSFVNSNLKGVSFDLCQHDNVRFENCHITGCNIRQKMMLEDRIFIVKEKEVTRSFNKIEFILCTVDNLIFTGISIEDISKMNLGLCYAFKNQDELKKCAFDIYEKLGDNPVSASLNIKVIGKLELNPFLLTDFQYLKSKNISFDFTSAFSFLQGYVVKNRVETK